MTDVTVPQLAIDTT